MSIATFYRGWAVTIVPSGFLAISPDYEATYEGPEDGWVSNGLSAEAPTLKELHAEVDAIIEERDL